jgi:hypothetical protein
MTKIKFLEKVALLFGSVQPCPLGRLQINAFHKTSLAGTL